MQRKLTRRKFAAVAALAGAGFMAPNIVTGSKKKEAYSRGIVGHGSYRYKVNKKWGAQNPDKIPVKDCHEMVQDKKGRLILLTNETKNNIIIYNRSGKVLKTWGHDFPGAHGLTLLKEGEEEFLFITDHDRHQIFKTTLDGEILMTLDYPREAGVYKNDGQYKPTEVAVAPNGDFYVVDGYGLDYVIQYNRSGEYIRHFGGRGDGEEQFRTAHGICVDLRNPSEPVLLITSRSKQEFKRFTLDGQYMETIKTPGCWINRPVVHGRELYFSVLQTKSSWAYDGFVIILDENNKIVSAPGGSQPIYRGEVAQEIIYDGTTFMNPHDVCIDRDQNLYIPQWFSGKTYPVQLERI
ncbi:6-bladed beta-propeller [Fulvivirgaceae bacterium BMA10]|uniref:6-bladed beta-propeller n=1 Tax=Splendidivirga corallicola TaxID=3051826 RepID=A0ABT8KXJ5_9BACT|nr:6-bladed beta-propeller [Fulvivirgaceae bacterium BMA10]